MFHPTLVRNMTLEEKIHYGLIPEDVEDLVSESLKTELEEVKYELEEKNKHLLRKIQRLEEQLVAERNKRISLFPGSHIL